MKCMNYIMKMRLAHVKEPQIKKRMITKKNKRSTENLPLNCKFSFNVP